MQLAIVIGASLTGVAPEVAAACDLHVCLPESRGFGQVRFCRYRFSPTGELGYKGIRGAEG
jgi:hypothetical protein